MARRLGDGGWNHLPLNIEADSAAARRRRHRDDACADGTAADRGRCAEDGAPEGGLAGPNCREGRSLRAAALPGAACWRRSDGLHSREHSL